MKHTVWSLLILLTACSPAQQSALYETVNPLPVKEIIKLPDTDAKKLADIEAAHKRASEEYDRSRNALEEIKRSLAGRYDAVAETRWYGTWGSSECYSKATAEFLNGYVIIDRSRLCPPKKGK